MSLKAKIEAVIYAAEEPVTPAQLAALFQSEVIEVREARLSAEAAARAESSPGQQPEEAAEAATTEIPESKDAEEAPAIEPTSQADGDSENLSVAESAASTSETAPAAEDEKKAARQREREIRDELRAVLDVLIADYSTGDRGMEIREIAGGYRVATKPEYHDAVRGFVKSLKPPLKLSLQALETLAVIAYKQPVTAPEVSEIRGVDSGGVLGSLVSRKLIATAGRKQVIGRPILYKTTKEFLLRFGLKDLNELPSIEEFEKMASELADTDEAAESGPEIAKPELPFQPNAEEMAEAIAEEEALEAAEPIEVEIAITAVDSIEVIDESNAEGNSRAEGGESGSESGKEPVNVSVEVEPEVKPADMVEAGEATASVGQPGEGD